MANKAGKPLFCWLMGKRSEVHQFLLQARELGLPAFDELHRTVECMAAVFSRKKVIKN
jgi:acetyltransferase